MGRKRTNTLMIRWSAEERNLIEKQAEEEGLTLSAFIRTTVIKHCRRARKEE